MCLEAAASDIANGSASSPTVRSPPERLRSIRRRTGRGRRRYDRHDADTGAAMATLTESNPSTVNTPAGHFSHAVLVHAPATLLFVSGQVPRDAQGHTVGHGSMTTQAVTVFNNLQGILAAHGATFADVVKFTIYVTRMDLAEEVAAVRRHYCGDSRPASTFIGVASLREPGWWLEVELVAALSLPPRAV